ncbi:MAG TPA: hypothetical protein VJX95_00990 [Oscillospiraceae bacterium]|nr:hypothetical protein [Oscillospiraceae bacterium]
MRDIFSNPDDFNKDFIEFKMMEDDLELENQQEYDTQTEDIEESSDDSSYKERRSRTPLKDTLVRISSASQEISKESILPQGEPLFKLRYMLTDDENVEGLKNFQNKFLMKKYLIYTALFSVIAILYIVQIILNSDSKMNYAMLGICVAVIFFIWYNPINVRKNLRKALEYTRDNTYLLDIYEDCVVASSELPPEEIENEDDKPTPSVVGYESGLGKFAVELLDEDKMFMLVVHRQYFYVIPKRCLTDEEERGIKEFFDRRLGTNQL